MIQVPLFQPVIAPILKSGRVGQWCSPVMPAQHYRVGKRGLVPDYQVGPGCTACSRSKKRPQGGGPFPIKKPMFSAGIDKERTLYVVLSQLDYGSSGGFAIRTLRELGWDGNIAVDLPVKCGPGTVTPVQREACRTYLSYVFDATKPERVLLCGNLATSSVLGYPIATRTNRGSWTQIETDYGSVPTVATCEPRLAQTNPFWRKAFINECQQLLGLEAMPIKRAMGWIIETEKDAIQAVEWALREREVAYDVETYARPFDRRFRVISAALASADTAYIWGQVAINDPALREHLRFVLECPDIGKTGQNVKYDNVAALAAFGWDVAPVTGCARLMSKLDNIDMSASLEDIAFLDGIFAHKSEIQPYLQAAVTELRTSGELDPEDLDKREIYAFAYDKIPETVRTRYVGEDAVATHRGVVRARARLQTTFLHQTWERLMQPANRMLSRVEVNGLPVSLDAIDISHHYLEVEIEKLRPRFEKVNIDPDSPKSILDYLAREGIDTPIKTKLGAPSTSRKALEKISALDKFKEHHWVINDLLSHRSLAKLLSSYAINLKRFVRRDGRVHPTFDLAGARTGRLSCRAPNAQQVPTRGPLSKLIKDVFVAPPGYSILQSDYATLEIFMAAILADDDAMIEACTQHDYHWETAKRIAPLAWKMSGAELEAIAAHDPARKKLWREASKTLGFAMLYGSGAKSVAERLKIIKEVAADLIVALFNAYPGVYEHIQRAKNFARRNGYAIIPWDGDLKQPGRVRPLWPIASAGSIDDDAARGNAERAAYNTVIQGAANDYCLRSAVAIDQWLEANPFVPAKIIGLVHDSIIMEVRDDLVPEMASLMREKMTQWPSGRLKLRVDIEAGRSWGSLEKVAA